MLTRRTIGLFAFALTACCVATALTAAAEDASSRAFVASIYNAYKGKLGNGIALDKEATLRRYFEPSLAALISNDQKEAARRNEAPALDSDPFVDASDWEIAAFDINLRDVASGKATATVSFRNAGKPTTVVLDLVKIKNDWRIADITWQRDGKLESLRSLFAH